MTQNTKHRVIAGFISGLALLAAISMFLRESNAAQLRQDHAVASGVITSKSAGMHGVVEYMFVVGGKEYTGKGVGGAQREFGAKIDVYYYPKDPSNSSLHDPLVWQSPGWFLVVIPLAICLIACGRAAGWVKTVS